MLSSRPELWPRTSPVTLLKARICVVGGGSGYQWRLSRFGVWAPIWGHVCIRGSHCHWGHAYLDDLECSRADPYPLSAMWRHAWGEKCSLSFTPCYLWRAGELFQGPKSGRAGLVPHRWLRADSVPYLRNTLELLARDISSELVLWTRDSKRGTCHLSLMLCGGMGRVNMPSTLYPLLLPQTRQESRTGPVPH